MFKKELFFHHIGIAVKDLDKAIMTYENLGYELTHEGIVRDDIQDVSIAFLNNHSGPLLELIQPESSASPVQGVLNRNGPGSYHTCYEVDNLNEVLASLLSLKFIQIGQIVPAIAFNNRLICFAYHSEIGVIELLNK